MQLVIVKTTIDRKTGDVLEKSIIGLKEIDEKVYWEPLLAVLHRGFESRAEGKPGNYYVKLEKRLANRKEVEA